jgi:hypothetical protein
MQIVAAPDQDSRATPAAAPPNRPAVVPAPAPVPGKKVGLLFGLNYVRTPQSKLNGCINDIHDTGKLLKDVYSFDEVKAFDDETAYDDTTMLGIVRNLQDLALRSWAENLAVAWIHYSGHGTSVPDRNGDERDGLDECLCPSDYTTAGFIKDDDIAVLLSRFNPRTRVVFIVDACHSGTMGDLRFSYKDRVTKTIENPRARCAARVVLVSGCMDVQTSADATFMDASGAPRPAGALTSCLLRAIKENPAGAARDVFGLVDKVRAYLKAGGFVQYPMLTSSVDLSSNPVMF